ncbi:AhpC/TSA family protein [Polaribacter sp. BAL334]|uniref:TlpA disulfide reductase family protein n=1 Tax=Polaribacter sp. BAL334 TaxID=1708178 RepID=UPI0018D22111|nr:TlpA disulfide reductase family protein [Polaribacter sp. BAL334]MBG7610908.1 AhpC/TSA family protein [Polaribacter sp. BAL334]
MTYKKIYFLIFSIIFLVFINCTKNDKINESDYYEINATIKGVKENSKVLLYNYEKEEVIDSTIVNQGKFNFKGELEFPFQAGIMIDDGEKILIGLWAEEGEIIIETDIETIKENQFKTNDFVIGNEINPLNLSYQNLLKKLYAKRNEKYQQMKNGIISEKDFQKYKDSILTITYNFFNDKSNADNYFSLSQMIYFKEGISKKDLKNYYDKLSQKLKDSPKGKALYDYFTFEGVKVGEIAPEIIAKNVNGKVISLKDYRGNYVLLDFWASWCKPCIEEIKTTLPVLQKKYQADNFKIVSFSFDVDEKSWLKSSTDLQIDWINISDNKKLSTSSVAFKYGVSEIPSSFLISPDGIVLKRFQYGEDLLKGVEKVIK